MESHPSKIPFEFSNITPTIYLGTNACCTVHFEKHLLALGIQADISLEKERLEQPFGVKYFLWLPTQNHEPPSLKQLNVGVQFLHALCNAGVKTYVHCQWGHGRSPTLVIAFLMSEGMSFVNSYRFVKKRRPSIHLTSKQIAFLKKYEVNSMKGCNMCSVKKPTKKKKVKK